VRIFIAGPLEESGGTTAAFADAAGRLEAAGHETVNGLHTFFERPLYRMWHHWAVHELSSCDGLALLDGPWHRSPGTMLEVGYAMAAKIPCRSLDCWLQHLGWDRPCGCES
jgi:hypothetical protein